MTPQPNFKPILPVRTNTAGSQDSQSSGQFSPTSPTSPTSRATSPTEQSFFGAITARVRGRSRSRSRDSSKRSNPPMVSPPRQMAQQQQQSRNISIAVPEQPVRPSLQNTHRRSTGGSDPWRGRHSNEWLFGGWSATETAKNLVRRQS